jgi:hypothetical protein
MSDVSEQPGFEHHWPEPFYYVGQVEHVHALGVISLAFNALEDKMRDIFDLYTGLPVEASSYLFSKPSNELRIDLLQKCIDSSDHDDNVRDAVRHFLKAFCICFQNRSILMHSMTIKSMHSGTPEATLILAKIAKGSPTRKNNYYATLNMLRNIADEMADFVRYGKSLYYYIPWKHRPPRARPGAENYTRTLPDKPDLPTLLKAANP